MYFVKLLIKKKKLVTEVHMYIQAVLVGVVF